MRSWIFGCAVSGILQWHPEMESDIDRRLEIASYSGTQAVHGGGVVFGGKRIL